MAIFMNRKPDTDPAKFWREYGERYGEKVLAYSLGRYLSGWDGYDEPLWGLAIATDGGFRFHHFPHEGWLQALSRMTSGGEGPKEKTIFIPRDRLFSAELRIETSWLKKIFTPHPPILVIRYRTTAGTELAETELNGGTELNQGAAELFVETDYKAGDLLRCLQPDDPRRS
ncbi:MAG: hypothetical protein LBQ38_14280 [Spirochaetaceae bacterium]|jgi:hypothetical protein|nr:hypothetical protein [Spirochaetaceae bacterium]